MTMYIITLTTPKLNREIVGATTDLKTAESMAHELHTQTLLDAHFSQDEIESAENLHDLCDDISVSIDNVQVTSPKPPQPTKRQEIMLRLFPISEIAEEVVEGWDMGSLVEFGTESQEEFYRKDLKEYEEQVIDTKLYLDQDEEPAVSSEEVEEFAEFYQVEISTDDLADPIIRHLIREYN